MRKEAAKHFEASQGVFAADQKSHNRPSRLTFRNRASYI
jgi:hypothetical protein